MPGQKKKMLNVQERILLYLSTKAEHTRDEFEAPFYITQKGIANKVGISRRNVPRAVNKLIEKGMVESVKAHIAGLKQKRKAYFLTSLGYSKAAELNLSLSGKTIRVMNPDGSVQIAILKELPKRYPELSNYCDIVREVEYGILDTEKIRQKIEYEQKKFLDYSSVLVRPPFFFGRKTEKEAVRTWYSAPGSPILIIKGIAGIGKTTLIADMAGEFDKHHVFCMKIHHWTTLRNIVTALSEFIFKLGDDELSRYIRSTESVDLSEVQLILEKSMPANILLAFDDSHNASQAVGDFMRVIFEIVRSGESIKLIVSGRSAPPFYDRRSVLRNEVKEILLTGLDRESCRKILEVTKASTEHIDWIHRETQGHPLFVELSDGKDIRGSGDIKKFIFEAFYSHLANSEKTLLDYISVIRHPVDESMVSTGRDVLASILSKGTLTEKADGGYELHDLLKDFIYRSQGEKSRRKNHSSAADYYLGQTGTNSLFECIHHRIMAGESQQASELILANGSELLASGSPEIPASFIGKVLVAYSKLENKKRVELLLLLSECLQLLGDWDAALSHYDELMSLCRETGQRELLARAHLETGKLMQRRNQLSESKESLLIAGDLYNEMKDARGLGEVEYQLGNVGSRQADYGAAESHFDRCIEMAEKADDTRLLAKAHNAYGRMYLTRKHCADSFTHFERARELLEELDESRELAKTYIGLGGCAFDGGDIDASVLYFKKAVELTEKSGDVRVNAYALSNLASAQMEKSDMNLAVNNLNSAWDIFYKLGEKKMLASIYVNYGVINTIKEKWREALDNFNDAIEILESIDDKIGVTRAKHRRGTLFKLKGDVKMASINLHEACSYYKEIGEEKMAKKIEAELKELKAAS